MIRHDGTSYSYVSKETSDLSTLKINAGRLANEISAGGLSCLVETGEFSSSEVETLSRNAVAQLVGISKANDFDEVIHICLRNLNELGKYRIISDVTEQSSEQFDRICSNLLNVAEETRPLGARAYRKYKTAVVRSSPDASYSCLLISNVFTSCTSVYMSVFDEEEILGMPGPKENIFIVQKMPLEDQMYELLSALTSEKIVAVSPIQSNSRPSLAVAGSNLMENRVTHIAPTLKPSKRRFSTVSNSTTGTFRFKFKIENIECYVNSVDEMHSVLNSLCVRRPDGTWVVRD